MSSVVKSLSALQEPLLFEMLSSAFVCRISFEDHSCGFVDISVLCWHHHRRECADMMNINISVVNRKWNINCVTTWFLLLHIINLFMLCCCLYCFDKQFLVFVSMSFLILWPCCSLLLHQLLHWWVMFWPWFNLIVPVAFVRLST